MPALTAELDVAVAVVGGGWLYVMSSVVVVGRALLVVWSARSVARQEDRKSVV